MSTVETGNGTDAVNNSVPDHIFAPVILVGALLILQPQSILFWMWILGGDAPNLVTNSTAVITSAFLEVLALWRWFTPRKGVPVFALLVTGLLLAGPLYRVAYPLWSKNVEESQAAFQKSETIKVLSSEIDTLNAQLGTYLHDSASCQKLQGQIADTRKTLSTERRTLDQVPPASPADPGRVRALERDLASYVKDAAGCAGLPARMDAARQQLADRSEKYRQAVGIRETAELNLGRKAVILLHSLMLIAAQFGSVLAIRAIGRVYRGRGAAKIATPDAPAAASTPAASASHASAPATSTTLPRPPVASPPVVACSIAATPKPSDKEDIPVEVVERISTALTEHLDEMKKQNVSARTWASLNGYDRREFPLLKKHRELLESGERTASMKTIRRLGEYFKILASTEVVSQEVG